MSSMQLTFLPQLHKKIDESFSNGEIRTLCFKLKIDYEHLAGETKPERIVSLLLYLKRRVDFQLLLEILKKDRPAISWPSIPSSNEVFLAEINQFEKLNMRNSSGRAFEIGNAIGSGANVEAQVIAGRDVTIKYIQGKKEKSIPLQLPPRSEKFINREKILERLERELIPGSVMALNGPGGIGKSAIAAEIVYIFIKKGILQNRFPDGVIYYNFDENSQVTNVMEHIILSFGEFINVLSNDTVRDATRRALSGKHALIILDGTEVSEDLPLLLDLRSNCCVLVTSQSRKDADGGFIDVDPLQNNEAIALLKSWVPNLVTQNNIASEINKRVDGWPFAIQMIGRYLRRTEEDAKYFLEWLVEAPFDALQHGERKEENAVVLLEHSIAKLDEYSRDVLGLVGVLSPTYFRREIICLGLNIDMRQAGQWLGNLVELGLISKVKGYYQVSHRFIHTYSRSKLSVSSEVIQRLYEYYISLSTKQGTANDDLLKVEAPHVITILKKLKSEGEWQKTIDLSNTMGTFLKRNNQWTEFGTVLGLEKDATSALSYDSQHILKDLLVTQSILGHASSAMLFSTGMENARTVLSIQDNDKAIALLPINHLIGGRYEVVNRMSGGMAIVYLCRDHTTNQLVALKTIQPEYLSNRAVRDLFLREGTLWVEMGKHPNVVQAYRVERSRDGSEVYLVLEWIVQPKDKNAPSLRSWLRPGRPLPIETALLFALHIARGMRFASEKIQNIVHRDLKPENILVGHDGVARVTDFGLASTISQIGNFRNIGNPKNNIAHTHVMNGVAGTPLYMAPEQWAHKNLDLRTDIYALGCILYEMLTGRFAAQGHSMDELREIHLTGRIKPPDTNTPQPILNILRQCLSKQARYRFSSWEDVVFALEEAYRYITDLPVPQERRVGDHTVEERLANGESYNSMGMSYLDIGKLDVAALYFEQAVNIARNENSLELEGRSLGNLGLVYTNMGYLERAIEFHEENLSIARQTENVSQEGRALGNLGRVYRQKGNPEKAIHLHKKELSIAQDLADKYKETAALHSLGETYRQMGNSKEAINHYQQSLEIARDVGDKTRVERILNSMGKLFLESGEPKEAASLFKQTLDIARKIGDRVGEGEALGNLGELYYVAGYSNKAVEYYLTALKITTECNDRRKMIRNLHRLGDFYMDLGESKQANIYYKEALKISQDIHDQMSEMESYERLGKNYVLRGDYFESVRMYNFALQITGSLGVRERHEQLLIYMARAFEARGDWNRAIDFLEEARILLDAGTIPKKEIWYWNEIGHIYMRANQPRGAYDAFQAALEISRNQNLLSSVSDALNNLGDASRKMKDTFSAMEYYKEAQELAREYNNDAAESIAISNIGIAYQEMGKRWQAIRSLEKSVALAKKTRRVSSVANASLKLAEVLCAQNKWDKAEPHALLALQLFEKMEAKEETNYLERMLITIEKQKGKSSGFLNNIQNLRP